MTVARDVELAYRRAFDEFAKRVELIQTLAANANTDRNTLETALIELDKARVEYNHRRDEWAQYLLRSSRDSYHAVQNDEDRFCAAGRW